MKLIVEYVQTCPDSNRIDRFDYLTTVPFEYSSTKDLKALIQKRIGKFLRTKKWAKKTDRYIINEGYCLDLEQFIVDSGEYEEPDIMTVHEYFSNAEDSKYS